MTEREAMNKLFAVLKNLTAIADHGIPSDDLSNMQLAEADEAIQEAYVVIGEVAKEFDFLIRSRA